MCFYQDDGDPAQVWNASYPRARKVHQCHDCDGEIAKGEQHKLIECLHDGEWSKWRICNRCYQIRARIARKEHAEKCPIYAAWPPEGVPLDQCMRELQDQYVNERLPYNMSRPRRCVDIEALTAEVNRLWAVPVAVQPADDFVDW